MVSLLVVLSILSLVAATLLPLSKRKRSSPQQANPQPEATPPIRHHSPAVASGNLIKLHYKTLQVTQTEPMKFRTDSTGKNFCYADLASITCTCEDFLTRRAGFDQDEIQRLCGHLLRSFDKTQLWCEQEEIVTAMLQAGPAGGGTWAHHRIYREALHSGQAVYLGVRDGSKWVNVYTRKRKKGEKEGQFSGAYDKFGFNTEDRQWAYGIGPPAAREIKDIIARLR